MSEVKSTLNIKCVFKINCFMCEAFPIHPNRIGGIIIRVLASSAVDRGFENLSGQTKDYKISICCFSAKHAELKRKNTVWLSRNQNNVSERGDMRTRALLFQ